MPLKPQRVHLGQKRGERGEKPPAVLFWPSWLLNTSPMTHPTDKAINKSKTLFSSVGPGSYVVFSLAMPSRNFWGMWDPALMFLILLAMTSRNFLSYLQWPPETSAVSETSTRNFSSWLSLTHYVLQKLQVAPGCYGSSLVLLFFRNFNKKPVLRFTSYLLCCMETSTRLLMMFFKASSGTQSLWPPPSSPSLQKFRDSTVLRLLLT